MEIKRNLGERVRSLRKASGLSVAKLAAVANLSPQTIKDIESGRRSGGLEAALALSRAFRISVEQLIDEDYSPGEAPLLPYSVKASLKRFSSIPDEVYEAALTLNDPDDETWETVKTAIKVGIELKERARKKKENA